VHVFSSFQLCILVRDSNSYNIKWVTGKYRWKCKTSLLTQKISIWSVQSCQLECQKKYFFHTVRVFKCSSHCNQSIAILAHVQKCTRIYLAGFYYNTIYITPLSFPLDQPKTQEGLPEWIVVTPHYYPFRKSIVGLGSGLPQRIVV
jgi:hypothetical protein